MPIELDLLDKLKERVQLAKRIDTTNHRVKKDKHEKNWLKKAAEAMEIELDSDADARCVDFTNFAELMHIYCHRISDEDAPSKKRKETKEKQRIHALKTELKHLLSQPLVAKGVMKKYITSGARRIVPELLDASGTPAL